MLSKVTLDNAKGEPVTLHEDSAASKRQLIDAKGLVGVGPLRSSKRVRPQAHGSINETQFEEGRTIQLTGEVMSRVSIENALEEFRKISQVLLESLDGENPPLLKWTEAAAGLNLQMAVRLDSEIEPTLQEAAAFLQYPVSLFAEDPRAYSQTLTEATGASVTLGVSEPEWLKSTRNEISDAFGIAVDSGHIYWVNGGNIARATLAGGTVEPEWLKAATIGTATDLAISSTNIYWTSAGGTFIGRATIAGATVEKEWLNTTTSTAASIAVDSGHVYWHSQKAIGRATIAGGTIEKEWIPGLENYPSHGMTVSASFIYWCEGAHIGRATIAGGTIEKRWLEVGASVHGVAVSGTFIYWGSPGARMLGRAKIGGTEIVSFLSLGEGHEPVRVAINAEKVYWNDRQSGWVGRDAIGGAVPGGSVTITQTGNRPTPLRFKLHGSATNPIISRASDGARITLRGVITAGNYVEIDTAARTMLLNGKENLLGFLDAATTSWDAFQAPATPGSETYSITATEATGAFMEVLYRSAFA